MSALGASARLVFALGIGAIVASPTVAQERCQPVTGRFEAQLVPRDQCAAAFCTRGEVSGGIQGTYALTIGEQLPAKVVPSILFFVGSSAITTASGDLDGIDTGTVDMRHDGFVSLITFKGGTDKMTGATGQIRINGQLDQKRGRTAGDYAGTLCLPAPARR